MTEISLAENSLGEVLELSGHPSWRFLNWTATEEYSAAELKTFFMQEAFERGILVLSTHNMTLAHTPKVIKKISDVYSEIFFKLDRAIKCSTLREELKITPLKPLFTVR